MTGKIRFWTAALTLMLTATSCLAQSEAQGKWLHRVPDEDRVKRNPIRGQTNQVLAGGKLFADNCAKCHGADANGLRNRPSLRSARVRSATDGQLAWMLKNGNPYMGMPPWSSLPEIERWQIIAYLRTLPPGGGLKAARPRSAKATR